MPVRASAVACAALVILVPSWASADSLGDHIGPRELALGEARRADAQGASAIALNPAGLALGADLVFEGAYSYRFSDSAHAVTVSGCDSTVPVPGCFYYRYFTASPEIAGTTASHRVHEGGITLARSLSDGIAAGITSRYFDYNTELEESGDQSGFTVDAGLAVRPTPGISLAVAGYNLLDTGTLQYPRSIGGGVAVRPIASLTVAADGLWKLDRAEGVSTGRYGGGAEYFWRSGDGQVGYPIRLGVVHDVAVDGTYLTAGLSMVTTKISIDLGVRGQVQGGDELLLLASLRLFGPRQVAGAPRYE